MSEIINSPGGQPKIGTFH